MAIKLTTWTRHYGNEQDKRDLTKKIKARRMADHPWEPGPYGTCQRCGTNPDIAFPREQHPK